MTLLEKDFTAEPETKSKSNQYAQEGKTIKSILSVVHTQVLTDY